MSCKLFPMRQKRIAPDKQSPRSRCRVSGSVIGVIIQMCRTALFLLVADNADTVHVLNDSDACLLELSNDGLKVFAYGVGDVIIKGGRYDSLLSRFGKDAPAIGFVVIIDD